MHWKQLNEFVYSYANTSKLFLTLLEPDLIDFSLVSFTIIHNIFSSETEKKKTQWNQYKWQINICLDKIKKQAAWYDKFVFPSGSFFYTGRWRKMTLASISSDKALLKLNKKTP